MNLGSWNIGIITPNKCSLRDWFRYCWAKPFKTWEVEFRNCRTARRFLVGPIYFGERSDLPAPITVGSAVLHTNANRRRRNDGCVGTVVRVWRDATGERTFEVQWRDYPEPETCWKEELELA